MNQQNEQQYSDMFMLQQIKQYGSKIGNKYAYEFMINIHTYMVNDQREPCSKRWPTSVYSSFMSNLYLFYLFYLSLVLWQMRCAKEGREMQVVFYL